MIYKAKCTDTLQNRPCTWVRRATPKPYRGTLQFALLTHAWVRRAFFVRGLGGHLTPVLIQVASGEGFFCIAVKIPNLQLSHSHTHINTHTHTLTQTHTLSHTHTNIHTLTLSLSHTNIHSLSHTQTHTHTC